MNRDRSLESYGAVKRIGQRYIAFLFFLVLILAALHLFFFKFEAGEVHWFN